MSCCKPKQREISAEERKPLLLKTLRGENQSEMVPFWYMRQAGRYLPEYNEIRKGLSFTDLCENVDLAHEVTLQPYRRFRMDGIILFSDILTPLAGAGVPLHFEEKRGPVLGRTIESEADLALLDSFDPERDTAFVGAILDKLRDTIDSGKAGEGESYGDPMRFCEIHHAPTLLGFAGAPFTLASYLIEGGTSKKFEKTKGFVFGNSKLFHKLSDRLADITIEYLRMQIRHGAQAVQLFDSWGGIFSAPDYREFSTPYIDKIINGLRSHTDSASTPIILFTGNSAHLIDELVALKPNAISLDWRVDPARALEQIPESIAIQGNLDPLLLYGTAPRIREETQRILNAFASRKNHVFNLGHGIHPESKIKLVETMITAVRAFRRPQ